jgi:hypothetical protein
MGFWVKVDASPEATGVQPLIWPLKPERLIRGEKMRRELDQSPSSSPADALEVEAEAMGNTPSTFCLENEVEVSNLERP